MEMKVHRWLSESEQAQWVCSHVLDFVTHARQGDGNTIEAVGLVNYRDPSAVVFLTKPLEENDVLLFLRSHQTLRPVFNGLNRLSGIRCEEHFVDVEQWNETQA
jgi:hypothetical protein